MAFTIQDVVKADIVLLGVRLLGKQEELDAFGQSIDTDVQIAGAGLVADLSSGATEPGRLLAINRDRITLDLSRSRSAISREFPSRGDLRRLANVAGQAIDNTSFDDQQLRAFGFNIEIVFDQHTETVAFEYLSRRIFNARALGNQGWQLVGGAGRLMFSDNGRRWTVNLEPRFNRASESRVFMGVNLHLSGQSMPSEQEIGAFLEELWDESHEIINRLDAGDD